MNAACLRPNLGQFPTFLTALSLAKFLRPCYLYVSVFQPKLFNTRGWHCALAFSSLSSQSQQHFRSFCPKSLPTFFFSEKHHGLHNHPLKKQQKLHFYIIEFLLVKDARVTASDTTVTFVHCPSTVTAAAVGLFSELSNLRY